MEAICNTSRINEGTLRTEFFHSGPKPGASQHKPGAESFNVLNQMK
jgi:hypothetical protein